MAKNMSVMSTTDCCSGKIGDECANAVAPTTTWATVAIAFKAQFAYPDLAQFAYPDLASTALA